MATGERVGMRRKVLYIIKGGERMMKKKTDSSN
jgi:hypothetical protein